MRAILESPLQRNLEKFRADLKIAPTNNFEGIRRNNYDHRPDFMYSYDYIWSYFDRLHSLSLLGFEEEQDKI
jgi:hypothetical protein